VEDAIPISTNIYSISKDFLQFFDISPDALLIIDQTGTIIVINTQMERIFGYSQLELLGQHVEMLLPECFRKIHVSHREHFFADSRQRPMGIGLQLFGLRQDKTEFPVDISLRPLMLENKLHVIAAIRDMTAQKRAENELKSLYEQQKRYNTFLSMASHELRTPLASIQATTQMFSRNLIRLYSPILEKKKMTIEATQEGLAEMTNQITRLNRLIGDLLDISRTNDGHLSFSFSDFEIGELVRDIVNMLQKTVSTHTISIHGKGKQHIYADRDRIGQVLTNLLTNGIKYSPEAKDIEVSISRAADSVIISVRDYGIGIAREYQPHIFEQYYRLVDDEHKKYAGLGIGLYIAAEIVRRHNGKIWVESEEGKGSTFSFSLPVDKGVSV
jgi:PAS domain S-box-containing protein